MILRRSSAAACRPKDARRVRVGGERRVSLARHRDVGTQHLKTTPTASEKRGWGTDFSGHTPYVLEIRSYAH